MRVEGAAQHSGVTANDFTAAREYEVVAEDGSTAVYTVRVTDHLGLVVNELDVDQVGLDTAEFIELFATDTVDLWGVWVVLVNGGVSPGLEYGRIDLSSIGIDRVRNIPRACRPPRPGCPTGREDHTRGLGVLQQDPERSERCRDALGQRSGGESWTPSATRACSTAP